MSRYSSHCGVFVSVTASLTSAACFPEASACWHVSHKHHEVSDLLLHVCLCTSGFSFNLVTTTFLHHSRCKLLNMVNSCNVMMWCNRIIGYFWWKFDYGLKQKFKVFMSHFRTTWIFFPPQPIRHAKHAVSFTRCWEEMCHLCVGCVAGTHKCLMTAGVMRFQFVTLKIAPKPAVHRRDFEFEVVFLQVNPWSSVMCHFTCFGHNNTNNFIAHKI